MDTSGSAKNINGVPRMLLWVLLTPIRRILLVFKHNMYYIFVHAAISTSPSLVEHVQRNTIVVSTILVSLGVGVVRIRWLLQTKKMFKLRTHFIGESQLCELCGYDLRLSS